MARKHSIIIGGTKGLGRELAGVFAAEGQLVTAVGRSAGELPPHEVGNVIGLAADLEKPDALLAALRTHLAANGKLSSLVFRISS